MMIRAIITYRGDRFFFQTQVLSTISSLLNFLLIFAGLSCLPFDEQTNWMSDISLLNLIGILD